MSLLHDHETFLPSDIAIGRPKKAFITSPTDVIPEDQRDVRKVPLAALLLAADETAVSPTPDPKPQAAQGREDSTRQQ